MRTIIVGLMLFVCLSGRAAAQHHHPAAAGGGVVVHVPSHVVQQGALQGIGHEVNAIQQQITVLQHQMQQLTTHGIQPVVGHSSHPISHGAQAGSSQSGSALHHGGHHVAGPTNGNVGTGVSPASARANRVFDPRTNPFTGKPLQPGTATNPRHTSPFKHITIARAVTKPAAVRAHHPVTVPASNTTTNAPSTLWFPGSQQLLTWTMPATATTTHPLATSPLRPSTSQPTSHPPAMPANNAVRLPSTPSPPGGEHAGHRHRRASDAARSADPEAAVRLERQPGDGQPGRDRDDDGK
jgi:hypothetical protein